MERWARAQVYLGDVTEFERKHYFGYTAVWVTDIDDAHEAMEQGIRLENLEPVSVISPERSGRRRVAIRAFTWTAKEEISTGTGFDPDWITLGWGMSVKQAVDNMDRWIRDYESGLQANTASRVLIATALEIVWSVAGPYSEYV